MTAELRGLWLGTRPYDDVLTLQRALQEERSAGRGVDTVLLLEHTPVITLGRGGRAEHLLASEELLAARGIHVVAVDRGGDVTLHAPGQLVAYPIVALGPEERDVRRYVRALGQVMCSLVAAEGLAAGYVDALVGVWTDLADPRRWPGPEAALRMAKLGAIGVRITRWVTMHGFALNLSIDLDLFRLIVPCGLSQYAVTSVLAASGRAPAVADVARAAFVELAARLGRRAGLLEDATGLAYLGSLAQGAAVAVGE